MSDETADIIIAFLKTIFVLRLAYFFFFKNFAESSDLGPLKKEISDLKYEIKELKECTERRKHEEK